MAANAATQNRFMQMLLVRGKSGDSEPQSATPFKPGNPIIANQQMPAIQRIDSSIRRLALFGSTGTRVIETRATAALPAHTLMRRAGMATAQLALALAPHARTVWIAAGPGNNGGDGLEAALWLRQQGKRSVVTLAGDPSRGPADAKDAFERARAGGVAFEADAPSLGPHDIAIDGLLGIGGSRAPAGRLADDVRRLNGLPCPVLAIDVPSGLNADTGQPFGADCVVATSTLSLLSLKPGLFTGAGRDHAGTVWFDALGVEIPAEHAPDAWLCGHPAVQADAVIRHHAAHKGTFGDVAVVGGAEGMTGAAILAARAAHAAGAGRIFVALLRATAHPSPELDVERPELMFRAGWCESAPAVLAQTTVVCGCGGGDAIRAPLPRLVSLAGRLVLDADALNAIAGDRGLRAALLSRRTRQLQTVLTPHPLEAARLLDGRTAAVQADRIGAARELAERYGCVAVLKGSGTVIAAPDTVPVVNATGNAALASAGTGDVLAGLIGGRWAQAASLSNGGAGFDVAGRAVAAQGAAAEPAMPGALRAADLIETLYARERAAR
jgi:hydroxyethylthiazole kinase-like uncharacterized protein yjeF